MSNDKWIHPEVFGEDAQRNFNKICNQVIDSIKKQLFPSLGDSISGDKVKSILAVLIGCQLKLGFMLNDNEEEDKAYCILILDKLHKEIVKNRKLQQEAATE